MAFDFKKSLIKVQGGRTYLPVSARIVWFREDHPDWGIITEPLEINHEKQYAVFRATIFNADGKVMAMGTKKEDVKGFGDYIEKAETGSVGRALALCGYGTQFSPELDETSNGRLADSPYPVGGSRYGNGGQSGGGGNYGGSSPGGNNNRFGNGGGYNNGNSGGNDGGNRFNAPREMSTPPTGSREDAPARPTSESPPRQGTAPEVTARPAVVPDNPPRRPAPASITSDEDDEFEALISDTEPVLSTGEDDPFGDDAPAPTSSTPSSTPYAAVKAASATGDGSPAPIGHPACVGCGKALTKAQQDLSVRNYGEALCPGCQKDKGRAKQPALAGR
jgi:hypothetical protein